VIDVSAMRLPRFLVLLFILLIALPPTHSAAAQFDGSTPGPFRVEVKNTDPEGVSSSWSRGHVHFTVSPGLELTVLGMEQEPMVKLDKNGGTYYNEHSSTWWGTAIGGEERMAKTAENFEFVVDPDWVPLEPGQVLDMFDTRIDYFDDSVHPDIEDGTVLYSFRYKILLDGEPFIYEGDLVFDSTVDLDAAASMKKRGAELLGDRYVPATDLPAKPQDASPPYVILAVLPILGLVAGLLLHRRRGRGA